ncbi:MAG: hypothetical protein AAF705_11590 [Bacteroidota bacterium]
MKKLLFFFYCLCACTCYAQKTVHIYVALCDNVNQGIVPVPKSLGNGQNARTNLYWGALYGVKTHFKKSKDWSFVKTIESKNPKILERVLFKHKEADVYLLAEAYDGRYIKNTITDFLESLAGNQQMTLIHQGRSLSFAGKADLVSYIGHNGLMEFSVNGSFNNTTTQKKDAILLACISKSYFSSYLKQTKSNPLVWSTGLMSPEAYTLEWALQGWVAGETNKQIRERAAQAYNHYQKCGLRGAKRLLVSGF